MLLSASNGRPRRWGKQHSFERYRQIKCPQTEAGGTVATEGKHRRWWLALLHKNLKYYGNSRAPGMLDCGKVA